MTWICTVCENENPSGSRCQFCTSCACDDCGAIGKLEPQACGDEICADCVENRNEAAAERQWEATCEEFYGGSAPFTARERAEYADREERGLL